MVSCTRCYSVNLDGSKTCGVCGSRLVYSPFAEQPFVPIVQRPFRPKKNRAKGLAALTVGAAILTAGMFFVFLSNDITMTGVGVFIMILGATILLTLLGVFERAPYRISGIPVGR